MISHRKKVYTTLYFRLMIKNLTSLLQLGVLALPVVPCVFALFSWGEQGLSQGDCQGQEQFLLSFGLEREWLEHWLLSEQCLTENYVRKLIQY